MDCILTSHTIVATVHWLFGTNRTPALNCDHHEPFPESDYLVIMKHGHAYKVPLRDHNGQVVTYEKLTSIIQTIAQQSPDGTNWASIFTTANRDDWAKVSTYIYLKEYYGMLTVF